MRNVRAVNLLNKLNYLAKNQNLVGSRLIATNSSSSGLLNNSERAKSSGESGPNFTHSKRHSSGHGSSGGGFGKTGIVYTLLGAGAAGAIVGVFLSVGGGKKEVEKQLTSSPVRYTTPSSSSSAAAAEEEAPAETPVAEEEQETTPVVETKKTEQPKSEAKATSSETSSSGVEKDKQNFLPEIPSHAQYLIVGGGTAAMSAFKAIRAKDPKAKVLVVTEEDYKPYMRPPLSKDIWFTEDEKLVSDLRFKQYNGNERSLFFLEDEFYVPAQTLNQNPNGGVAVVTGKRVTQVDIQNQTVRLDNNWEIAYDKCLIATGGKPKNLGVFENEWAKLKDKVTLFRNIEDFKRLYSIAKEGKTIAIVGGGFLGSELACALGKFAKKHGGKVIQIFPESGNLRKVLPEYLSEWATARVREEGVEIIPKTSVNKAQLNDKKVELSLGASNSKSGGDQQWLLADHVVVAVGLEPNVQLATKSGFEIDSSLGGYVVNAELQARKNIWIAGDAACFYDIKLGRRRVEHHDHAVVSGRLAGENMTGAGKPYWHQSMFWSDLGPKIGFEAIGLVDSSLPTVGLFAKADETDTPQAQVNESNEALRSEVKDSKVPDVSKGSSPDLRQPSNFDDFGKGVILYLRNETIVGVLLWNVFKRIPIARQLIQSQEKVTDYAEMAKLFKINATGLEETSESK